MGVHDFKLNKVPLFFSKNSEYQCFALCCPTLAVVPASRYYCDVNWSTMSVPSFIRIERGSEGCP